MIRVFSQPQLDKLAQMIDGDNEMRATAQQILTKGRLERLRIEWNKKDSALRKLTQIGFALVFAALCGLFWQYGFKHWEFMVSYIVPFVILILGNALFIFILFAAILTD